MFDAAAAATAAELAPEHVATQQADAAMHADASHDGAHAGASTPDPLLDAISTYDPPATQRREVVFVDSTIADYQTLLAGINPEAEIIVLDGRRDGIAQITEALENRTGVDAIHLVAEGNEAELHLGTSFLTQNSLSTVYAQQFQQIGQSLSQNADLLIYGCNFGQGEAGQLAMQTLAQLTGADVAASTDYTGHADQTGNWVLETATGSIEASVVIGAYAQSAWDHVLATYTITSTFDGAGADTTVGTLRYAITQSNASVGVTDTIAFAIGSGAQTITLTSTLPTITDRVTIDGWTQSGFAGTPLIRVDGNNVATNGIRLSSTADNSIVRGLVLTRFTTDGIRIDTGADGITIAGNWIGTTGTGSTGVGNGDDGIDLRGSLAIIGGTGPNDRNVITNNVDEGIDIVGSGVTGHLIQGNYIGLDPDGSTNNGIGDVGIAIISGSGNTIGGTTAAARNVISRMFEGIEINTSNNIVQGNYIGTDVTGTLNRGNRIGDGVQLQGSSTGNVVGGNAANTGNLIAYNAGNGVAVVNGSGDAILGNQIYSNTLLGIDLGTAGVTANDSGDGDSGANDLLNFPIITKVVQNGANLDVTLVLDVPAGNYRIELFQNPSGIDSSRYGEGQVFLGALSVTSTGSGAQTFTGTLNSVTATSITRISATATRDLGSGTYSSTSEFGPRAGLVVSTTNDTLDGTVTSVEALIANPGADGHISLREALTAANASGGTDYIYFDITSALVGGVHTITLAYDGPDAGTTPDAMPTITSPVVINGWTEPDYAGTPIIELNGNNVGTLVKGLTLGAGSSGSTVKGLIINRFTGTGLEISGSNNHIVQGNWIGLNNTGTAAAANGVKGIYALNATGLLIGTNADGTNDAAERNVISGNAEQGIYFDNADNSTIAGNYVGTNVAGTGDVTGTGANTLQSGVFLTNGSSGNVIGTNLDGNNDAAERNVISGNNHYGFEVLGATSQNNLVQGNYMGTTVSGLAALGNTDGGASFWGSGTGNVLGGGAAGAGNVISANATGVLVGSGSTGATIQGNYIGVGADGVTLLGNSGIGVDIQGSSTNTLVGSDNNGTNDVAERNIIAGNNVGIGVSGAATTGNALLSNSIYGNTNLGIDLGANAVTPNDAGDGDTGANNLQNFPVLTSARTNGSNQLILVGTLNTTANMQFRIEFFANTAQDGTGYGEGQRYLGFVNVTTDGSGNATISTTLTATVAVSEFVSATATKSNAGFTAFTDSSEFAQNVTATATNNAPVLDNTKSPTLTTQNEDSGVPSGAVGTLVSTLVDFASPAGQVDNVTDVDSGALLGMAITTADTTNGTWWYSTNGGTTWNVLGAVANNNARLLAADANTRVYFQSNTNYNGTMASAITFRAWDQTSGSNGTLADTSSNGGTTAFSTVADTAALTVSAVNDAPSFYLGTGLVTTGFGAGTTSFINAVAVQPDGKIVAVGYTQSGGNNDIAIARYNTDATLDTSFGAGTGKVTTPIGLSADEAYGVVILANGKILVAGRAIFSGSYDIALVQYNADGTFDTSFGGGTGIATSGIAGTDEGYAVSVQADGKILVAGGDNTNFLLARFNSNGSLDTTFGASGRITTDFSAGNDGARGITLQSDGKILLGGYAFNGTSFDFAVARYNTDGTLDTTFNGTGKVLVDIGTNSSDSGRSIFLQPDGRILVAGWSDAAGTNDFALARLNANGSLDTSFNGTGKTTTTIGNGSDLGISVAVQADGKILVVGQSNTAGNNFGVARFNTNGSLDTTFNGTGKVDLNFGGSSDDRGQAVAVQADGRIVVAGTSTVNGSYDFAIARFNTDGTVDTRFNTSDTLGGTIAYTENAAAVVLDSNVSIFDAELSTLNNFNGSTLTLVRNGGANSEDLFSAIGVLGALTQGGNLVYSATTIGTVTTNTSGTLVLTFNSSATQTLVNSAMRLIGYSNSSDTPPASVLITWTFNDGNAGAQGSGGALTATGNTTVNITAVNDAPVVDLNGVGAGQDVTTAFTEQTPVLIAPVGTLTDVDSANLSSLTLTLTARPDGNAVESLALNAGATAAASGAGLTVTYTAATGVLSITGSATKAVYQTILQGVLYNDTSESPTTSTRSITVVANDGALPSATQTATITVTAVNDAPIAADDRLALDFDGVDDFVQVGSNPVFVVTNTVTMEAWINPDSVSGNSQIIVNKEGEYEMGIGPNGNLWWAFANTDPGWNWHDTGFAIPLHTWSHVAVSYNTGVVTSYVNGAAVETYNGSGSIGTATRSSMTFASADARTTQPYSISTDASTTCSSGTSHERAERSSAT